MLVTLGTERVKGTVSRNLSKFKWCKLPQVGCNIKITAQNIKGRYKKHSKYKKKKRMVKREED